MRAVVLADTHIRDSGSSRLADHVWEEVRQADVVLHAGDLVSVSFLDQLPGDGQLLFNPGSPTQRRRQPHRTFGLLEIDAGSVRAEILRAD